MKKILACFLFVLNVSLPTAAFALDCEDLIGLWSGDLGSLTSVELDVRKLDPSPYATIAFQTYNSRRLYGIRDGNCKTQDGKVILDLFRDMDDYYKIKIQLNAELVSEKLLTVKSFTYSQFSPPGVAGSGTGTLRKL